jgi:hypothetical protein
MRYHNVCAEFDVDVIEKFTSKLVPNQQISKGDGIRGVKLMHDIYIAYLQHFLTFFIVSCHCKTWSRLTGDNIKICFDYSSRLGSTTVMGEVTRGHPGQIAWRRHELYSFKVFHVLKNNKLDDHIKNNRKIML